MDEKILAALRSKDAEMRRKGIIAAGKSGAAGYIKPLNHLVFTESDTELRVLGEKAVQRLRSNGTGGAVEINIAPPASRPSTQPRPITSPTKTSPTLSKPPSLRKPAPPRYSMRRMIPFVLFIVILVGAATYYIVSTRGDALRRQLYVTDLVARMLNAEQLPRDGSKSAEALNGQLFKSTISDTATFYIQEPVGTMPPDGWPIVMCVAGGTPRAEDCYGWLGERTARERVLFVAPSFGDSSGNWISDTGLFDIRAAVDELSAYYTINWKRSVMYGFSYGGYYASYYAANYPLDFAGTVMGDPAGFELPVTNTPMRYGVISGDQLGYQNEALGFGVAMQQRGTPIWRQQILRGVGHTVTIDHLNMVFDLMTELSAASP